MLFLHFFRIWSVPLDCHFKMLPFDIYKLAFSLTFVFPQKVPSVVWKTPYLISFDPANEKWI